MRSRVIVISGNSREPSTITKEQENEIRSYLFGQLKEAEEESVELRLLTESSFVEEFDTVVDEITDQYIRGELQGSERKHLEETFLTTAEGKQKLRFASELLGQADARHGATVAKPVGEINREPGFFERIYAFWQSQSMRLAATAAAVVIIAGGIFLISKSFHFGSTNFAQLNLSISEASRNEGPPAAKVKLESGMAGIQPTLAIPEHARGAKDYRVRLITGDGSERDLTIEQRNDQSVTVKIPASLLRRGRYALQISSINSDGTPQRIPGSYYFDVE